MMVTGDEPNGPILLGGTAMIDIVSVADGDPVRPQLDNLGRTSFHFGGNAYNVALNMKLLGLDVRFLSALNTRPLARLFRDEIAAQGIDAYIHDAPDLPDQIFNALFHGGLCYAKIWCDDMMTEDLPADLCARACKDIAALVFATPLSMATTETLLTCAARLDFPVFAGNMLLSGPEMIRLCAGGRIDLFVASDHEFEICLSAQDDIRDAAHLADMLGCPLVLTRGRRGADVYFSADRVVTVPVREEDMSGTELGAGDLYLSVALKTLAAKTPGRGKLKEDDLLAALDHAGTQAAKILSCEHANLGAPDAVMARLEKYTSSK